MARGVLNIPSSERGFTGGTFVRGIRLKEDKESCRIRFLTEDDEVFFASFHDSRIPPVFGDVCVKEEFSEECNKCEKGERFKTQWLAWVYEYTHDYVNEGDIPEDVEDYETIELGSGRKIYRVEVNDIGLMCYARGHKGSIVHFSEKYGTLLDRDYEWSRNGKSGDMETTYMLEPEDKGKMSTELKKLMNDLPDLEKIATGEVTTIDNEEEEDDKGEIFEEPEVADRTLNDKGGSRSRKKVEEPVEEEDEGDPF